MEEETKNYIENLIDEIYQLKEFQKIMNESHKNLCEHVGTLVTRIEKLEKRYQYHTHQGLLNP